MSLIEGVDDEIVLAVGTFAVVSTAVALAWRSTRVQNAAPQPPQQESGDTGNSSQNNQERNQTSPNVENDVPPSTGQPVRLKLKFLNDTERTVDVTEDWTIGQLKRIHLAQELEGGRRVVRLVFRGRELADVAQKISEAGLADMSTIHCLVSEQRNTGGTQQQQQRQPNAIPAHRVPSNNFDNLTEYDEVGRLLMPLLTIVLGCVWYARIRYRSLFDGFSSLALIAFTLAFLAAVAAHFYRLLGFGRPSNNNNPANPQVPQPQPNQGENSSASTANRQTISEPAADASRTESNYPSYPPPPYSRESDPPQSDHNHVD